MSVTSLIEFDDASEHFYDTSKLELLDDKGKLLFLPIASEILFSNFDGNVLPTLPTVSKRGNKTLVFSGTNNTGEVSDNILKFPNQDRSRAAYENITDIVGDFAFRAKAILNVNPTTPREILRLISNVDASAVTFIAANQGAGVTRITRTLYNSAGALVSSVVCGTLTVNPGVSFVNLAFSCDADGVTRTFYNGAQVSSAATPPLNFTDCELRFNNNDQAVAHFDNVQLFNSNAITATFANPFPEATDYSLGEQVMLTKIPFPLDEITLLEIVSPEIAGTSLKHFMCFDNKPYWNDPADSTWKISNVTLAESNTLEEIQANLATLPLTKGVASVFEIGHIFESATGYATPEIESVSVKYKHEFKSDEVNTCLVSGVVKDNASCPVEGATVRVNSTDKFYNNNFIGPAAKAVTDEQGKWSMSIPETETANSTVDFAVEYKQLAFANGAEFIENVVFPYKNKIIPNLPSAKFAELD